MLAQNSVSSGSNIAENGRSGAITILATVVGEVGNKIPIRCYELTIGTGKNGHFLYCIEQTMKNYAYDQP